MENFLTKSNYNIVYNKLNFIGEEYENEIIE